MILNMLRARDDARAARDFETADDIRSVLREDWGVSLVDDMREWWVGGDRGGGDNERGARRGQELAAWSRSPDDTADIDKERVMALIKVYIYTYTHTLTHTHTHSHTHRERRTHKHTFRNGTRRGRRATSIRPTPCVTLSSRSAAWRSTTVYASTGYK
jgi:hypothetical protein